MINYEDLVKTLVLPLVMKSDEVVVEKSVDDEGLLTIQVLVDKDDLGRVIGKGGKIAQAIRTITYAGASKEGIKIKINIDAKSNE